MKGDTIDEPVVDYGNGMRYLTIIVAMVIILCIVALVNLFKRKQFKSFEILMINLFLQNIGFMSTLIIVYVHGIFYRVVVSIKWYFYFLQLGTLCTLSVQKTIIIYFPLKASIWITKQRTLIIIVGEYVIFSSALVIWISQYTKDDHTAKKVTIKPSAINITSAALVVIMTLGTIIANILMLFWICKKRQECGGDSLTARLRSRRHRKTTLLLMVISSSYILSYVLPCISFNKSMATSSIFSVDVYLNFLWIDAFVNALSYLLLKTKLGMKITDRIMGCKRKRRNGMYETAKYWIECIQITNMPILIGELSFSSRRQKKTKQGIQSRKIS